MLNDRYYDLTDGARAWINLVSPDGDTVAELVDMYGRGISAATVRRHLNAGVEAGLLTRSVRGHGNRTCYVYYSA